MDSSGPVGPHFQIVGRTFSRCQMVVSKPGEGKCNMMKAYFPIFAMVMFTASGGPFLRVSPLELACVTFGTGASLLWNWPNFERVGLALG